MTEKVYYYCNSDEINMITDTVVVEIAKVDITEDLILTNINNQLKTDHQELIESLLATRGGIVSKELKNLDADFDRDFICFKNFVASNKNMNDGQVVSDANYIWDLIGKFDYQLHKQSYETQFTQAHLLFDKLEEEDAKARIDNLIGVPDRILAMKASLEKAENCYRELNADGGHLKDMLAPSSQKNILRNLINDKLLPHLNNMVEIQGDKYGALLSAINNRIEDVNAKARSRKTRHANAESEEGESDIEQD
eukprot:TRINITY_DN846_c1_g2_i4.p1 TRINITY_DN846_c1_g2~~TRINITY_DN846_c1_g2_i4.p1  ORF type:complete len:252 (+),score=6.97 TRINITY_DN846_c1_g2_i4:368-1123(+)